MRYKVWLVAGVVSLAGAAGCQRRDDRGQQQTERSPTAQAQQRAEDALAEAQRAQEKATAQQKEVREAEEEARAQQQELTRAQQEVQRERQEAQEAQQQARQKAQEAEQRARQSQQEALTAQREAQREPAPAAPPPAEGQPPPEQAQAQPEQARPAPEPAEVPPEQADGQTQALARGQPVVESGTVRQVRGDELVLDRPTGPDLHLKVEPETTVQAGGQPRSLDQLAVGSQVRVQYRLIQDQPVAESIEQLPAPTRQGRRAR